MFDQVERIVALVSPALASPGAVLVDSAGTAQVGVSYESRPEIGFGLALALRRFAASRAISSGLWCGRGARLNLIQATNATTPSTVQRTRAPRVVPSSVPIGSSSDSTPRDASPRCTAGRARNASSARRRFFSDSIALACAARSDRCSAALARTWGAEVLVLTPDERTAAASGAEAVMLKTLAAHPALVLDRHSALVMLFHDHDWETHLLMQALAQDTLFIGAMGSRATHARRIEALARAGATPDAIARVTGPIGLIPAARDPQTLALSVLAQVVAAYNAA